MFGYAFTSLMSVVFVGPVAVVAALTVIASGSRPRIERHDQRLAVLSARADRRRHLVA